MLLFSLLHFLPLDLSPTISCANNCHDFSFLCPTTTTTFINYPPTIFTRGSTHAMKSHRHAHDIKPHYDQSRHFTGNCTYRNSFSEFLWLPFLLYYYLLPGCTLAVLISLLCFSFFTHSISVSPVFLSTVIPVMVPSHLKVTLWNFKIMITLTRSLASGMSCIFPGPG